MGATQIKFTSTAPDKEVRQRLYNSYLRQGFTELMVAIVAKDTPTALGLIEKGEGLNVKNNVGMTALMLASLQTYHLMEWVFSNPKPNFIESTVEALIRKQVPINERDATGFTALGYAKARAHRGVIELLERNGAIE
ncbi:MAG: ankyrin repeat domain-containing protein [Candidatus Micrarchaeaceae archaeon]|jgi:ankyrin repeat protein